jgi:hypothetical protein
MMKILTQKMLGAQGLGQLLAFSSYLLAFRQTKDWKAQNDFGGPVGGMWCGP